MHHTQPWRGPVPVRAIMVGTALAGAVFSGCWAWWRHGPRRVVVEGASMVPTLQPGDRLVVCPAGRRPVWRKGDIVAFGDPRRPDGPVLIKRVLAVGPAGIDVRGDNERASTDSRSFGPVDPRTVIGRARYRYGPPGRAGPLGPGRPSRAEP